MRVIKGKNDNLKLNCNFHVLRTTLKELIAQKDYLKSLTISYYINKQFEQRKELNPTVFLYQKPVAFTTRKDEILLFAEYEYYTTVESILEYRFTVN